MRLRYGKGLRDLMVRTTLDLVSQHIQLVSVFLIPMTNPELLFSLIRV